jgi:nitrate reductase cytochrome c-type subunit
MGEEEDGKLFGKYGKKNRTVKHATHNRSHRRNHCLNCHSLAKQRARDLERVTIDALLCIIAVLSEGNDSAKDEQRAR